MDSVILGLLAFWLAADGLGYFVPHRDRRQFLQEDIPFDWGELLAGWVDPLAGRLKRWFPEVIAHLEREQGVLLEANVSASRRFAIWLILSGLAGIAVLWLNLMFQFASFDSSIVLAGLVSLGALLYQSQAFLQSAMSARQEVLADLPTAIELLARIIEAGTGDLMTAWYMVEIEFHGRKLGGHFRYVLNEVDRGKTPRESLQNWADFTRDPEVNEVVLLLKTTLERGSPLRESLQNLAEQSRLRRIQHLERAAGAAKVHITWPGFLVVIACLLIACAPLILTAIDIWGEVLP